MKTSVSIPNEIFTKIDRLARRKKRSRSELVSAALREYIARHDVNEATEAMNRVCDAVADVPDPAVQSASRRALERAEW